MVSSFIENGYLTAILCIGAPLLGWIFSFFYYLETARIKINPQEQSSMDSGNDSLLSDSLTKEQATQVWKIYNLIYEGAHSFLYAEYKYIGYFIVVFSVVILVVLGVTHDWVDSVMTVIAFVVGCLTSVLSGFVGMKIGVFANARTAVMSQKSLTDGFRTSFKAAVVMGFCLCSFGVFNLYILCMLYRLYYSNAFDNAKDTENMFESIAGYGLGGSSIALFGRVGGGIFTKAADVGADLVGKVENDIPEDDPRNPAVIADNVGDNVGDIAGMGADLFGSFAEASCAALVIASQTGELVSGSGSTFSSDVWQNWGFVSFPLVISSVGIIVCFLTSFVATHCFPVRDKTQIEPTLKRQLLISTILMTLGLLGISLGTLEEDNVYESTAYESKKHVKNWKIFFCAASGLWAGLAIGYITEYYTSNQYDPVKEVAEACTTGAATNIIIGLALGYKSAIIPVMALSFSAWLSIELAGFYGVAMAALGILSTLSIGLTIDAFGPISDNAGGIAEMAELGDQTREFTDALDAAGNTTAAIGKGFAIGSAAFVSLALFSGYVTIVQNRRASALTAVNILESFPFAGLILGAMIPYWFSALTMKSVGKAAFSMVREVRDQFRNDPGILKGTSEPNYGNCITISTEASLREMFAPGMLVMLTPLIIGFLFGVKALAGYLAGSLVSGVQMAISASNTGGAWDNAKKYVEQGGMNNDKYGQDNGKGSDVHKAAVVGDTVGDPLKDTSGPALNIVMKLQAIISLVFARAFPLNFGGLLGKAFNYNIWVFVVIVILLFVVSAAFLYIFDRIMEKFDDSEVLNEQQNNSSIN